MKYEIIKGSENDFEGAPEWATMAVVFNGAGGHGIDFSDGMSEGARVFYAHSKKETEIVFPRHWKIIAERRPINELVWDGEGLPPVGSKVMTKSGEGIIDYVGVSVIIYTNNDGQWSVRCDSLDYALSAIRSPEDVARDETIASIYNTYMDIEHSDCIAQGIYDAIASGKIPGVKLE